MNESNNLISDTETRLVQAMERAVSLGWRISDDVVFDKRRKRCCALGSLMLDDEGISSTEYHPTLALIAHKFGFSNAQAVSFVDGFDNYGTPNALYNANWYELGQKLRKRFINKK